MKINTDTLFVFVSIFFFGILLFSVLITFITGKGVIVELLTLSSIFLLVIIFISDLIRGV